MTNNNNNNNRNKKKNAVEKKRTKRKTHDEINSYIIGILLFIHIICWWWWLCCVCGANRFMNNVIFILRVFDMIPDHSFAWAFVFVFFCCLFVCLYFGWFFFSSALLCFALRCLPLKSFTCWISFNFSFECANGLNGLQWHRCLWIFGFWSLFLLFALCLLRFLFSFPFLYVFFLLFVFCFVSNLFSYFTSFVWLMLLCAECNGLFKQWMKNEDTMFGMLSSIWFSKILSMNQQDHWRWSGQNCTLDWTLCCIWCSSNHSMMHYNVVCEYTMISNKQRPMIIARNKQNLS